MFLEIKDLNQEELNKITEVFTTRVRKIHSIYDEVCRIEADCSLERVMGEKNITLTDEEYKEAINKISEEIGYSCEDTAFQDMCEIADEITRRYITE